MGTAAATLIGALLWLRSLLIGFVLTALLCLALRSLLLLGFDRGRSWSVVLVRLVSAFIFGALAIGYFLFAARLAAWSVGAVSVALATALVLLGSLFLRPRSDRPPRAPGALSAVSQLSMLLGLLLLAALTLMNAGFLALTEDRPALLVDVTGEVRPQLVRWAPPDQAGREETLTAHRVVFRTPEGAAVADAWIYGDQVAVKGRVLRLSPMLNAAGIPNLFELQFAHNGYLTADRHSTHPHLAVPLPPSGPLAVHPWWRPLQTRLLEAWEKASPEGSRWAIRSVSSESTYYPLVDPSGQPVRQTFRLVLTPGGLSSS